MLRTKFVYAAAALGLVISLAGLTNAALQEPAAGTATQDAAPAADGERAQPRGRLPLYYAEVVTEEQREQIYTIQQDYGPQLQELLDQLLAARAEMNAKIEGVLTPEQKQKIEGLRAAAKAKRDQRRQQQGTVPNTDAPSTDAPAAPDKP